MVSDNDGSNIRPSEFQRYLRQLTRQVEEGILRSAGIPREYLHERERESDQVDAMRYAWRNLDPYYRGYYNPNLNIIEGKARVIKQPVLLLGPGKIEAEKKDED